MATAVLPDMMPPKRGRGRPRKAISNENGVTGRPRGRPCKSEATQPAGQRGRGRPRKHEAAARVVRKYQQNQYSYRPLYRWVSQHEESTAVMNNLLNKSRKSGQPHVLYGQSLSLEMAHLRGMNNDSKSSCTRIFPTG